MNLRKFNYFLTGLAAALLLGPLNAEAQLQLQRPALYLGGSWGAYNIERGALDDNDDVLKAFVGGQFNEWVAIEGFWTDFNRLDNGAGDRFDADGTGLALVLSAPVGPSSVFVKGGHYWWDANSTVGNVAGAGDGDDPFWGLGLKFGLNKHVAVRLEGERYDVVDTTLDSFTAGLEVKF